MEYNLTSNPQEDYASFCRRRAFTTNYYNVDGIPVKEVFNEDGTASCYYHLEYGQWKEGRGVTLEVFSDEGVFTDPDDFQAMVEEFRTRSKSSQPLTDDSINEVISGFSANVSDLAKLTLQIAPAEVIRLLDVLEKRFAARPELHEGVEWKDVEKSLRKNPEAIRKLHVLDEAGFEMNVFGEDGNDFIFRMSQADIGNGIKNQEYKNIAYDESVKKATQLGVELADEELYKKLMVYRGWVWIKTDDATRGLGYAFEGTNVGRFRIDVDNRATYGSFCAALRVPKAV